MVLPFGVSVGDFIAVAQLTHQISAELKRNPESAADYQDLVIELEALNRALKQLQAIKPTQHNVNLEAVRALAVTCRSPLETFLEKISKFEKSLGPWKPHHGQFRGFGRRLQWSTVYKDDIAALRAKLAPKSATITLLLLAQTIESIAKAESDRDSINREVAGKIFGQQMLMADAVDKINSLSITLQDLKASQARLGLQLRGHRHELSPLKLKADALLRHSARQERLLTRQENALEQIRADISVLKIQTCAMFTANVNSQQDLHEIKSSTKTILGRTLDVMLLVTAGVSQINHILGSVSKLRDVMTSFTFEMRQAVFRLLQEFYEIRMRLSVIERLLPKQINLPFIRFRDAFNEVRVFPYDLSRSWNSFQILVTAAFTNRQGLHRVNAGQYFITHARIRQRLEPAFWTNAIRPGDELAMTIILDDVHSEENICPFPACGFSTSGVETTSEGKRCPNCHRLSSFSQGLNTNSSQLSDEASRLSVELLGLREGRTRISDPKALILAPNESTASNSILEDIELYHSVQVSSIFDISRDHSTEDLSTQVPEDIRTFTFTTYKQPGAKPMSFIAFADTGAAYNITHKDISDRLGLKIDGSERPIIKGGVLGQEVRALGKVQVSFRLGEWRKRYTSSFLVLPPQEDFNVLLGWPFLSQEILMGY